MVFNFIRLTRLFKKRFSLILVFVLLLAFILPSFPIMVAKVYDLAYIEGGFRQYGLVTAAEANAATTLRGDVQLIMTEVASIFNFYQNVVATILDPNGIEVFHKNLPIDMSNHLRRDNVYFTWEIPDNAIEGRYSVNLNTTIPTRFFELDYQNKNASYFNVLSSTNNIVKIDTSKTVGKISPYVVGINGPTKGIKWAGDNTIKQRIRDGGFRMIRIGPVQAKKYGYGSDTCKSASDCDFSVMDSIIKTAFDSGAEPLFLVVGYPGGFGENDWNSYSEFMKKVVQRYNVDLILGRKVKYWELWNEPTLEPDGKIPAKGEYKNFADIVGKSMKSVDPSIQLLGPASDIYDNSTYSWLSFAANNINTFDILSWHTYGPDPQFPDQDRLMLTKKLYHDNIIESRTHPSFSSFRTPIRAITEFNMNYQKGDDAFKSKYRGDINSIYTASSIINAINARIDIFLHFNLVGQDINLYGLVENSQNYTPFKTYYAMQIMGKGVKDYLVSTEPVNVNNTIEYVVTKNLDEKSISIIIINKNTHSNSELTVLIPDAKDGKYIGKKLGQSNSMPADSTMIVKDSALKINLEHLSINHVTIPIK